MGLGMKLGTFVAEVEAEVEDTTGGGLFNRSGSKLGLSSEKGSKEILKVGGAMALAPMAKTLNKITDTLKKPQMFGSVKSIMQDYMGAVGDTLLIGLLFIVDKLWDGLKDFGNWLIDKAGDLWDWISGGEHKFWEWLTEIPHIFWDWLTEGAADLWGWLTGGGRPGPGGGEKMHHFWDWLSSGTAGLWGWLSGGAEDIGYNLWNWLTSSMTGIVDAVKILLIDAADKAADLWDWLKIGNANLWGWITNGIENIGDGLWTWISGIGEGGMSFQSIGGYSVSTITPGTKFVKWLKGGSGDYDPGMKTFKWISGDKKNMDGDTFWKWLVGGLASPGGAFFGWILKMFYGDDVTIDDEQKNEYEWNEQEGTWVTLSTGVVPIGVPIYLPVKDPLDVPYD